MQHLGHTSSKALPSTVRSLRGCGLAPKIVMIPSVAVDDGISELLVSVVVMEELDETEVVESWTGVCTGNFEPAAPVHLHPV